MEVISPGFKDEMVQLIQIHFSPLTQQFADAFQTRSLASFPDSDPLPENSTEVWKDLPGGRPVASVHIPGPTVLDEVLLVSWYSRDLEWSALLVIPNPGSFYEEHDDRSLHDVLYDHAKALDLHFSSAPSSERPLPAEVRESGADRAR